MATHAIPGKVMEKVGQMYKDADKERVIEALESGKTVYRGNVKLRGVKVEGDKSKEATASELNTPPTPAAETIEPKKHGKDK